MKKTISLLLAVLLFITAAGCSKRGEAAETPAPTEDAVPPATATPTPAPTSTLKPTPTPSPTPEPTPTPTPAPKYRNPFNGEPIDEPWTARPFSVMVNNKIEAQPQCETGKADILYEALAEGGVTRMLAIFSDIRSAEHLGSIRSIRPYFIDLSLAYGAVTCHAGGSDEAYRRIRYEGIENIDGVRGPYTASVFYRDSWRRSHGYWIEHTLFTEGQNLYDCAETTLGYPLTVSEDYQTGLDFIEDATPANGEAASNIQIDFNVGKSTTVVYHEDTGLYSLQQFGKDYIDGNSEELVCFRNVLAIAAATRIVDAEARLSVTLTGTGDGYYACGGKYIPITWSREDLADCFHYYTADGKPLNVSVGKTYIAILSAGKSKIEFT